MRPRTKDDYWYKRITDAEPPKIYRYCPKCGAKTGIPITNKMKSCFMCGETIYVDEELNQKSRMKIMFEKKLKEKGLKLNVKKTTRRKKI